MQDSKRRWILNRFYTKITILIIYNIFDKFIHIDYSTQHYEKSSGGNVLRSKTKTGFLDNLNAKLAEQRISGKAFSVRSIINSKALVSLLINKFVYLLALKINQCKSFVLKIRRDGMIFID